MVPASPPSQEEESVSFESNDVIFGRGSAKQKNAGNVRYRQLIRAHKERYDKARSHQKTRIVEEIISKLESQGSRMVKLLDCDGPRQRWVRVDQIQIARKVRKALLQIGMREASSDKNTARKPKSPVDEVQAFRECIVGEECLRPRAPLPLCPPRSAEIRLPSSSSSQCAGVQNPNFCSTYGISTTHLPVDKPSTLETQRSNGTVDKLLGNRHQGRYTEEVAATGNESMPLQHISFPSNPLPTTNPITEAADNLGLTQSAVLEWRQPNKLQTMTRRDHEDKSTLSYSHILPRRRSLDSSPRPLNPPSSLNPPVATLAGTSTLQDTVTNDVISNLAQQDRPIERTGISALSPYPPEEESTFSDLFRGRGGDQLSDVERRQEQLYKSVLRDLGVIPHHSK